MNNAGLQRAYATSVSPNIAEESQNWPFNILVSVGVPYVAVLDAYERVIEAEDHRQMGGVDPPRRLEHLTCVVVLLESWYTECRSVVPGSRNTASEQVCSLHSILPALLFIVVRFSPEWLLFLTPIAGSPHFLDGGCIKFWINTHQS